MAQFSKLTDADQSRLQHSRQLGTAPASKVSQLSPSRIAVGYAVVAILWIAFSDMFVTHFGLPPVAMTIKGTVFVFVTALLLYFTIRRLAYTIRLTSEELRTFVDHVGDALFIVELEQGTIVDVNREACESLGYTRQELIGNSAAAFHLESDRSCMESAVRSAVEDGNEVNTHRHRRKDGSTFPVEVHTSVVSHGGRQFLLNIARDITDRVQAEEQREKLHQLEADLAHINRVSMLGELAASVSHELKQPIAAAALHAEACLQWLGHDHPDVHEAGKAATRILDDLNRADEIIDHLRSLYRKSPPKRELIDLNDNIRQMVELLLVEATRHDVSISTEVSDGLPKIMADRVQLHQVLMNLMLNAIEAMSDTGGVLTVRAELDQDNRVEISVSDTGVGLPQGKADRVFNAFFTTKAQGSGMGLSISRSIVESHGGEIWATNNEGRGATFYFALPIPTGAHASAAASD